MTVGELWRGAEEAGWGVRKRDLLRNYLHGFVIDPFDSELREVWGYLHGLSRRGGRNLSQTDGWIAATAWSRKLPLITDNYRDFSWINGLEVRTRLDNQVATSPRVRNTLIWTSLLHNL
jgi:predicted nucleic acid-binding protein